MARRSNLSCGGVAAFSFLLSIAVADETVRVSNALDGTSPWLASLRETVSADGNVVAFVSLADDLVPGDTNGVQDVFVFDRAAGTLTRVSVSSTGTEADRDSDAPALSADGRYVAFVSEALNLDGFTNPNGSNIYVHDRALGTTTLVSRGPNGTTAGAACWYPSISADGQKVAFSSGASDLVANDANGPYSDVFVWDAATGTLSLVSVDASGLAGDADSREPSLSSDGNVVAFESSATNFPDPPSAGDDAVYVKDLPSGELERVDLDDAGKPATTIFAVSGISDDGNLVLFTTSDALVPDDTNGAHDAYLRDRSAGTLERVTVATDGAQLEFNAFGACMSGDGRFVAFHTLSALVEDDTEDYYDVYVRDRLHHVTSRVSVGTFDEQPSTSVVLEPFRSHATKVSADGSVIAFETTAADFADHDDNHDFDVFVRVRDMIAAQSVHYGAGFPGRDGVVPTLVPQSDPYRGSTMAIDVTNSSVAASLAVLLLGDARANVPTTRGGTLLVDPLVYVLFPLDVGGSAFKAAVPTNWWASGLVLDLQAIELDPWAARGLSFTDGLELTLGDG